MGQKSARKEREVVDPDRQGAEKRAEQPFGGVLKHRLVFNRKSIIINIKTDIKTHFLLKSSSGDYGDSLVARVA